MLTSELEFDLPTDRIAQSPCDRRDGSRLLVYNRCNKSVSHHHFHELPELLPPKLSILRNDVSVLKARLPGKRPTGGTVECLLLRPTDPPETTWRCLLKPGGKAAKAGTFGLTGEYRAQVLESLPSGEYLVRFDLPKDKDAPSLAQRMGSLPLPPYVRRPANTADDERYQTVYAKDTNRTAVAAPTAGLHFTPELLEKFFFEWQKGYKVVYGIRETRSEGFLINTFRRFGYWIIKIFSENPIPMNAGDFRLIDRKIVDLLCKSFNPKPYLRGMIAELGFNQKGIPYKRDRRIKGNSKFGIIKLISLGINAITDHSTVPLRLASFFGLVILFLSIIGSAYYFYLKFIEQFL